MSLFEFIIESNKIEGITTVPTSYDLAAYNVLLLCPEVSIGDLSDFVYKIQRGSLLRSDEGMDVRVGSHIPPSGGEELIKDLKSLLRDVNKNFATPFKNYIKYESLHPYMDGNGRSGRALWLWQHLTFETLDFIPVSFLHLFHYETLRNFDEKEK